MNYGISFADQRSSDSGQGSANLSKALNAASLGLPVFPCRHVAETIIVRGEEKLLKPKRPLTDHGFEDATTDPIKILAWWTRWPDALVGIRTGAASGISVVDIDKKNDLDGFASLAEIDLHIPSACTIGTSKGSGGEHRYFRHPMGRTIGNGQGVLKHLVGHPTGLDIRGDGGYVILWGEMTADTFARIPEWSEALDEAMERDRLARANAAPARVYLPVPTDGIAALPSEKRMAAYASAALLNEAMELASAPSGERNGALYKAACRIGKYVHHGLIGVGAFESELLAACEANGVLGEDGRHVCVRTMDSGLRRAVNDPLPVPPDRPRPESHTSGATSQGKTEDAPGEKPTPSPDPDAPWGEPKPLFAATERAPYPVDALPGIAHAAVAEVNRFMKTPVELAAMSVLGAISLAIQGLVNVERTDRLYGPVSIFCLLIANSGERKSQIDKLFNDIIRTWEKEKKEKLKAKIDEYNASYAVWKSKLEGYDAGIKKASSDGNSITDLEASRRGIGDEPKRPRVPKLFREDESPENLAWALMNEWPSTGIISAEAGSVFGSYAMTPEKVMANLSLQNKLWDGAEQSIGRKGSESFTLHDARLTVNLQIQDVTLKIFCEKSGGLARGIGFFARFLVAKPVSTKGTRFFSEAPAEWPALTAFHERLKVLLDTDIKVEDDGSLKPVMLRMSPEAKAAWIILHDNIERELGAGGTLADVDDVASKAADNIARLAAIFHVFEHGVQDGIENGISAKYIKAAGEIVIWHLDESLRFFEELSMAPENSDAASLDKWLIGFCNKKGVTEIPKNKVKQSVSPRELGKKERFDPALEELADPEIGRARVVKIENKFVVQVNPALLKGGIK